MILHIDMDAFFASVEQRDNPELKGKPLAVGGKSSRSVVATASYEARQFGIHSAMPMFQALRRCPDLIVVPPDKKKYRAVSSQIMQLIYDYTPVVEQVSIDEAYLDLTGCEKASGTPHEVAKTIQQRIIDQFQLTCSIGGAPLKFMAKIASDLRKPNGITLIHKDQLRDFAMRIAIKKIPGVGKKAMKQMNLMGIKTLGDIHRFPETVIVGAFGKMGHRLLEFAHCRDSATVGTNDPRKSVSSETTLHRDIIRMDEIKKALLHHAQVVGRDLRQKGYFAATLSIKIKFADFSQMTRQLKVDPPTCTSHVIYHHALKLMEKVSLTQGIRLIGVGSSDLLTKDELDHLPSPSVQLDLFDDIPDALAATDQNREEGKKRGRSPLVSEKPSGKEAHRDGMAEKWERIDRTMDRINEKFGRAMVNKATLATPEKN